MHWLWSCAKVCTPLEQDRKKKPLLILYHIIWILAAVIFLLSLHNTSVFANPDVFFDSGGGDQASYYKLLIFNPCFNQIIFL